MAIIKFTDSNFQKLCAQYLEYVAESKVVATDFSGPSLYFHQRALEEMSQGFLGKTHLEMVYATLASWGMHRMGDTKTKMVEYSKFEEAILTLKPVLLELNGLRIEDISAANLPSLIRRLTDICFELVVSESDSRLVGNSKTLAHILPHLVPPIDRQYTIRFFITEPEALLNDQGKLRHVQNLDKDSEVEYFEKIMQRAYDFIKILKTEAQIPLSFPFNTSYPKIFDNLIVAYIKRIKKSSKEFLM